ncbi:glycoside hydrolase family 73 protein [Paraclostridium sordellii]|uniref:Cell wall hydrolase n=1 Tax=Paraclostridium sordellii TaxID=1505 RepID=A0A0C7G2J6_PARSO|nr:glucosaminidase domain-containing protein [Paeniclostridium sordellii]QYE98805.1 glucosaminidase domain-containing protein [Paeniclostridium sordellii]CEN77578.1 cell wall hydrolase [[Clostridium] sordellii] [Paeniclostridium sordellii]CEQ02665.1 cell wall hydrolase [[Clostridium] sordellii] [Paeniclostridium sordellii]
MKNKGFVALMIILITIIYTMITNYSLKEINKNEIDTLKFIELVDEVSENKAQINWKYVAAITGVMEKNNFKDITTKEIKEVSKQFLQKKNGKYELKSVDKILEELNFNNKQKNLTYEYINQLKDFGLMPQRLNSNSHYMKFINSIKDDAIKNYKKYKVLPSITIAQGILESGWGKSKLAKDYNNLFGIKADRYWKGDYVVLETREFQNNTINGKFRKYEKAGDSISDHAKFLAENNRYEKSGVFDANTYIHQAKALQNGGYSTDTNEKGEKVYAQRLIEIIRQYNLQIIDSEVQTN